MTMPDADFSWLSEPRLRKIVGALTAGGEARFVGGCVRDSLLGETPLDNDAIDIDIATDRTPEEMKALFDAAGIRWIATGEAHGTLTAVEDGLVAECTTLRADEETDGRHAQVRFTRNWDEDWRRRDFTINALYADPDGRIWDPAGGLEDLEARRVRFIGDARDRIREDALRILRFFRFSARFAEGYDADGLAAIREQADLLDILSRERVWSELRRTFAAKGAPRALAVACEVGVLQRLLPGVPRTDVFARLHAAGHWEPALSLAALWPGLPRDVLRERLKPSNEVLGRYAAIEATRDAIIRGIQAHELLYRFGREDAVAAAALAAAEGRQVPDGLVARLQADEVPVLPISGRDVIAKGVKPGAEVSEVMKRFEKLWLEAGAPSESQRTEELLNRALGSKPAG
ncbi:CCA tRNA nucleotidyltransferase [Parvularcula lutaonensis]|uniref:CCA tRNA nucleotidyltransferase n=1 Tax=Parvularcula lutaonensis TaxID=491923 RepID=A0ABV7M7G6_9PROT|nr:CCA tRNA nucleotidyltransferase [Parvularcula lutaonensis]GGY42143.1 poly(A) polymerase [Parvularcula lutaonensis]